VHDTAARFRYVRSTAWPPLAWLAEAVVGGGPVTVWHGERVEARRQWFGEVVWDGPFAEGGFDRTDIVYGSGGRARGREITFVASATTTDRLHTFERPDGVLVSNSLACLMARLDAAADPHHPHYPRDFTRIIDGIDTPPPPVRTSAGPIRLTYHHNLVWDGDRLSTTPKPRPTRDRRTYEAYRGFLVESLRRCAANAADPERGRRFELLGTISTGFDSTTVTALGKDAGLEATLTFAEARGGQDDDGSRIGEALGVPTIVRSREAWREHPLAEAAFLAADAKGEDVYFAGATDLLPGRLLLTGYGAGLWKQQAAVNDDLHRADQSGLSLAEFRLKTGFINLIVPTLGALPSDDVHALMHGDEMAPWQRGGGYDKPFCRRVLVEAGVPTDAFGQSNKAASVLFFDRRSFLTPRSLESFEPYHAGVAGASLKHRLRSVVERTAAATAGVTRQASAAAERVTGVRGLGRLSRSGRMEEAAWWEPRYRWLFAWAIEEAKKAYPRPDQPTTDATNP